jgi:hypothetical protein
MLIKIESMVSALIKVINQSNGDRSGTILVYLFKIAKHVRAGFTFLGQQSDFLSKVYQVERGYMDYLRSGASKIAPSTGHTSIRTSVPSDNRIIQALLDRRSRQVNLLQDGNFDVFCKTINYESDEECEIDPAAKEIDIRDKDEQWRKVSRKRDFGGVVEFHKPGTEGNRIHDYLMNSEDRVAPLNTAVLEYCPL